MPFKQGKEKTGGRIKGISVNKTTAEIREALQLIYSQNLQRLQEDLDAMGPFQRQQILDKLNSKFLPTLSKSENTNENSGSMTIKVEYGDSDTETPTETPENQW